MTYSKEIDDAIIMAKEEGNTVVEISTGWTKMREVVQMAGPLTASLKSHLMESVGLRYWISIATPHNAAGEGFTDDVEKVSISFPL